MDSFITIGQLGKIVNLPAKTIRFYESIKLIQQATRHENGYRAYTQKAVNELRLIKNARDLGLPIAEIKKLMNGCGDGCHHSRLSLQNDIGKYRTLVSQQIIQLQTLHGKLTQLEKKIESGCAFDAKNSYCCNILAQLLTTSKGGESNMDGSCCGGSCSC